MKARNAKIANVTNHKRMPTWQRTAKITKIARNQRIIKKQRLPKMQRL